MIKKIVWKDKAPRGVLKSVVIGHFTMWAIRQSPYLLPEKLHDAVEEFNRALDLNGVYMELTYLELRKRVSAAISNSDIILSWNIAKSGHSGPVFISRYGDPEPDDDFIDLDAMARNIAQSVWLEVCYDDGFFETLEIEGCG